MYYDDPFDPTLPNDYDDDFMESTYNHIDSESISDGTLTSKKRKRTKHDELENLDKGYVKTFIYKNSMKMPLEYFKTTNTQGAKIRNALTGIYEDYRVGKSTEDLFFKVASTITKDPKSESHLLFYDSPEQFEKHFHCELSDEIKRKWVDKSNLARSKEIKEANEKYEKEQTVVR
jgi:hypothetical protein